MTPITLSRFEKLRAFSYVDSYRACLSSEHDNCSGIQSHMDGLIRQLHRHGNEPTGWSFAAWKKGEHVASNLIGANAVTLEYRLNRDDTDIVNRLHDGAQRLGWTFFMLDSENQYGNTITVVFPTTDLINMNQYARLASIFAQELDEYGMEHGCLAGTHIVQIHRSTTPVVFQGTPLNAEREIKRTGKLYQNLNARKYEGSRPTRNRAGLVEATNHRIEDGLFDWPMSQQEVRAKSADELLSSLGIKLEA